MKTNLEDLPIILSWERITSNYRYIYWKIKPSALPLFRRLFNNPWRRFQRALDYLNLVNPNYNVNQYYNEIAPLKTYGDAVRYQEKQYEIVAERKRENAEKRDRTEWPDDLNNPD